MYIYIYIYICIYVYICIYIYVYNYEALDSWETGPYQQTRDDDSTSKLDSLTTPKIA